MVLSSGCWAFVNRVAKRQGGNADWYGEKTVNLNPNVFPAWGRSFQSNGFRGHLCDLVASRLIMVGVLDKDSS